MKKTIIYAFSTCTLAYALAAVLLFIFSVGQTGWSRIDNYMVTFLASGLTLALSEFTWWGGLYYMAILVPWFGSTLVLVLLLLWFDGGARRIWIFGGLSVFAYYLAMFLVFIIGGLIHGWGDVGYLFFPIWLVAGFGLGCLSAIIVEKIFKLKFAD